MYDVKVLPDLHTGTLYDNFINFSCSVPDLQTATNYGDFGNVSCYSIWTVIFFKNYLEISGGKTS